MPFQGSAANSKVYGSNYYQKHSTVTAGNNPNSTNSLLPSVGNKSLDLLSNNYKSNKSGSGKAMGKDSYLNYSGSK